MKNSESYPSPEDITSNTKNVHNHNIDLNSDHFIAAPASNQSDQTSKTEKRRRVEEKLEAKKLKEQLGPDILDCLDDDLWKNEF